MRQTTLAVVPRWACGAPACGSRSQGLTTTTDSPHLFSRLPLPPPDPAGPGGGSGRRADEAGAAMSWPILRSAGASPAGAWTAQRPQPLPSAGRRTFRLQPCRVVQHETVILLARHRTALEFAVPVPNLSHAERSRFEPPGVAGHVVTVPVVVQVIELAVLVPFPGPPGSRGRLAALRPRQYTAGGRQAAQLPASASGACG